MGSILQPGFLKWDGLKYVLDPTPGLPGPPGPPGPAGALAGPASGDLGGSYPSPSVIKIQGNAIATGGPADAQTLSWVAGTNSWTAVNQQVSTIAQLRTTRPITATAALNLQGYYAVGDGGGGVFYWNSASTTADNGGTIIQVTGVATGRWVRQLGTVVNVRWFGAKGDGVNNDYTPIQAALDYLQSQTVLGIGGGGQFTSYGVFLPRGNYSISTTLEMVGWLKMAGDAGTTIFSTNAAVNLLRIGGQFNIIENIQFVNGKSAIVFYGTSAHYGGNIGNVTGYGPNVISNCLFSANAGPSIYTDTTGVGQARSASTSLIVRECNFYTSSVGWVNFDGCKFADCYVSVAQIAGNPPWSVPVYTDDGYIMPAFVNGDDLVLENMTMVPASTNGAPPFGSWLAGNGRFRCTNVRFGGEGTLVIARSKAHIHYNGQDLFNVTTSNAAMFTFKHCAMSSCAGTNWMEIYDSFPLVIDVDMVLPTVSNGVNPLPNPSYGLIGSNGIWIDSVSCPTSTYLNTGQDLYYINFNIFDTVTTDFRFRTSNNPNGAAASIGSTDVTDQMKIHYVNERTIHGGIANLGVQNNLWPAGKISGAQSDTGFGFNIANGSNDTTTGYTINGYIGNGGTGQLGLGFNNVMNSSMSHGEYTISFAIKSQFPGKMVVQFADATNSTNNIYNIDAVDFSGSGQWQTLEATFYYDGYTFDGVPGLGMRFSTYYIPDGKQIWIGLFNLNRGRKAQPWTYPGNLSMGPEIIYSQYYGTSSPVSGTYVVRDIFWNTNPITNTPIGWVCVAAGTPGLWAPFGNIIFDPNQVATWNFDYDAATLTPGAITSWPSKKGPYDSSISDFTLVGTGTVIGTGGANNLPYVQGNGTTNILQTQHQVGQNVAREFFMIAKFNNASNGTIFDGAFNTDGRMQRTGTNTITFYAPFSLTGTSTDLQSWSLWHVYFSGGNAVVIINGKTIINAAIGAGAINNGLTLLNNETAADPGAVSIARVIGYTGVLSNNDRQSVLKYLASTYNVASEATTNNLAFVGSLTVGITTVSTATYTVDSGSVLDYLLLCNRTGAITVTLPAPTAGRVLEIGDASGAANTNNISIAPHGSEKIQGSNSNYVINLAWAWVKLTSNGTDWFVTGSYTGTVV